MRSTFTQKHTVDKFIQLYQESDNDRIICFRISTESVKSFIAPEFFTRTFCIEHSHFKKMAIAFLTISTTKLPKELFNKLQEYQKFHLSTNYGIEFIQSPLNSNERRDDLEEFNLKNNKILASWISSFNKKALFYQMDIFNAFLKDMNSLLVKIVIISNNIRKKKIIMLLFLSKVIIESSKDRIIIQVFKNYININIFQNKKQLKLKVFRTDYNLVKKSQEFFYLKNQEWIHDSKSTISM